MPESSFPNPSFPSVKEVGENALLVEYEPAIRLEVNRKLRLLALALDHSSLPGVTEIVPAYRSLMLYFNPEQTSAAELGRAIRELAKQDRFAAESASRLFRIPTVYGARYGPDLERVAAAAGLSPDEVVQLFSRQQYPVYCLGFLCCLVYLGGVPEPLQLPRLATPRTFLPAGSVGFAGAQGVVLPIDQPSGWHYIGRTFVSMYDPAQFPPTPICPGDLVECPSVSEDEARGWERRPLGDCLS